MEMTHMNAEDIIAYARDIKKNWKTNDPFEIAAKLGITILHRKDIFKGFTAQTIKCSGYPTIISINDNYTDFSKKILCAHELGHALLHENCINHFAVTSQNVATSVEQEANLFAIALLSDKNMERNLKLPLASMINYMLKAIIECNLKFKE